MKYLASFFILLFLVGCEPKPVDKEFDNTGKPLTITVHVYKNEKELTQALIDRNNALNVETPFKDVMREGWAEWKGSTCKIHTTDINYRTFETLGHELAHCLYGAYHKDGER